jgi:DNA-binding MarR family transcriptional regulator
MTMPPVPSDQPLSDQEYVALATFRTALRQFLAFSERAARDHDLTPAQHQLLLTVRAAEASGDAPTMSTIAEHLQLRLHSVGELVTRAVDNGLVTRDEDPDDRRRVRVATTVRGRERLETLSVLHRRELRRFRSEMFRLLEPIET